LKVLAFCYFLKYNLKVLTLQILRLEALDWWASLKKRDMCPWSEQIDERFIQISGPKPMC